MAGFEGYLTKGLASGLQSGVNMGMQLTQLKWQKKKQKELDDLNAKMNDTWNSIGQELISLANDGQLSDDDLLKIHTLTMAAPYEMQGIMQNLRSSLSQLKTKDFETQMEYVNAFYEYGQGVNPKDIDSMYEGFRNYITNPHAKILFEVADKRLRHEYEVGQKLEPWKKAETLPQEIRPEYLRGQGVTGIPEGTPEAPSMADEKSAITILKLFVNASPETFEKKKAELEQSKGLDLSAYSQDILRESGGELSNLYNTPSEVIANVKAPEGLTIVPSRDSKTGKYYATFQKKTTTPTPGERATSLPLQEGYRDKALGANTLEDKNKIIDTYEDAGYNPSEMPTDQEWIDGKLGELDDHVVMLKDITDENGNLMGSKEFKFKIGDDVESQKGEAWYKDIYEAYTFYLEELKKMGIDVSKYTKIKSPGEIKKGFWGKYPSIYY